MLALIVGLWPHIRCEQADAGLLVLFLSHFSLNEPFKSKYYYLQFLLDDRGRKPKHLRREKGGRIATESLSFFSK